MFPRMPTASFAHVLAALALLSGCRAPASTPQPLPVPTGTVVVSNMNDNTATIIDAATGHVRATLPTGPTPHEVTISRDGRTAVVSNYGVRGRPGNSLTVIDVESAVVLRTLTLTAFQRPHGMAFLPGDTLLAVTSEPAQAVLLVDVRDGRVITTLPTNGRTSHMLGLAANGDRLVTGNMSDNTISVIDVARRDSTALIAVARQPEGIALSPDGRWVWAGSNLDSLVVVIDLRRGAAVDTVRGFGMPYRIAVTPDGATVVVSDPLRGEVRVIGAADHRNRFRIAVPHDGIVATAEFPRSPSPEGVAVSRDSRWAFVTLQGRNQMATIDLARGVIVAYAPTGVWSDGIGYSPVSGIPQ